MQIESLISALLEERTLDARQWVIDADLEKMDFGEVPPPKGLSDIGIVVAAGIIELLAQRRGQAPPAWTAAIAGAPEPVWLVRIGRELPRTRQMCIDYGPEPLRRRNVFAPQEFLTYA